jgi:hypothetical protein
MALCTDAVDRRVHAGVLPDDSATKFGDTGTKRSLGSVRVVPHTRPTDTLPSPHVAGQRPARVPFSANALNRCVNVGPLANDPAP